MHKEDIYIYIFQARCLYNLIQQFVYSARSTMNSLNNGFLSLMIPTDLTFITASYIMKISWLNKFI